MSTIRALEFYSGIGGLHLALSRASTNAKVIQAFDWDQSACQVYSANHGPGIASRTDISTLTSDKLAGFNANLWLLSPACQPYTVLNPHAKGALDPRAQSFLHLLQDVLPEMAKTDKHPSYILVENVAGFESSATQQIQLSTLQSIGYTTLELLLTPLQFGIPNSRLRYYLLAKKKPLHFLNTDGPPSDIPLRHIPGQPQIFRDTKGLRVYLDSSREDRSESRIPDKVLQKWGRLFDIVLPSSRRTCCFTRGYTQLVERSGSILQENEDLDTTETFDTFLEAQSANRPDAVEILHPLRLRYFTPSELLRIFAFNPIDDGEQQGFTWPPGISKKTQYRLIGNSVNVRVVQALLEYLLKDVA